MSMFFKSGNSGTESLSYSGERFIPTDKASIMALEHYHRYYFARQFCEGKKVLDFACGEGYGCEILRQSAAEVYGCDISQEAVTYALQKYPTVNFRVGSLAEDLFAENSFDVITCFETIEHVEAEIQDAALKNFAKYLKPEGILFVSTPNLESPLWVPNSFHKKEFTEREFYQFLNKYFSYVRIIGQDVSCVSYMEDLSRASYLQIPELSQTHAPRYLIALCSQTPLSKVVPTFSVDITGSSFVQLAHVKRVVVNLAPWFNKIIKVLSFLMPTKRLKSKISRYRF